MDQKPTCESLNYKALRGNVCDLWLGISFLHMMPKVQAMEE